MCDRDDFIRSRIDLDGVAQRASETFKADRHHVAVRQLNPRAEAEGVGAEEMDVQVAGPAMPLEFEVMVLDVRQTMAHLGLAGLDLLRPHTPPVAFDHNLAGHGL